MYNDFLNSVTSIRYLYVILPCVHFCFHDNLLPVVSFWCFLIGQILLSPQSRDHAPEQFWCPISLDRLVYQQPYLDLRQSRYANFDGLSIHGQ